MALLEALESEIRRERRARLEAERLLEMKSAELYAVNARLRRLYDHAADAVFVHDREGRILDVNRIACQGLGYTRGELLSMTVSDIETIPESELREHWSRLDGETPVQIDGTHRRRDGSTFPVEVRVAEIESHPEPLFLAIVRDVSLRIQRRTELESSRKQLRRLASALTLTEAKERRRLAQVLHDTIGHDLAVVRMHVKKLDAVAKRRTHKMHASGAVKLIEDVVKRVRQVTFDLSPATLYELGLPAAINVVARVVTDQHGLKCAVEANGNWRILSTDIAILLFYATRELIHNAVKHAVAENIDVRLDFRKDAMTISVIDDGVGFETDVMVRDREVVGFGLFSIRERLAGLNGTLQINSERDLGSRVTIRVPRRSAGSFEREPG